MQLRQIREFLMLRKNKFSISNTAVEMNKAQSSLSRSLLLLEEEMRQPIFLRRGRRLLGLTPFGESLVPEFERMAVIENNIAARVRQKDQISQGEITIATTHTQARYYIPDVVLDMRRHFPSIKISLQQGNPLQLITMLRSREADFAVCTEAIETAADLDYKTCYHWRHVVIVPSGHPLANRREIDLKTLARYPLVTYVFGFTGRRHFQDSLNKAGLQPEVALSAMDTDVIKHYVRLGVGIGVIANICFEPTRDEDLRVLEISDVRDRFETKIAWLKEKYLTRAMRHTLRSVLNEGRKTQEWLARSRPELVADTPPPDAPMKP